MSRYGMKVADETVYGIQHPDEALRLIKKITDQYFGELWTQHRPRCPLCDTALTDCEKHMNRPVGECTNPKCDSTIHIADYFGKIIDILEEAELERKHRLEEEAKAAPTKSYHDEDDTVIELGGGAATAGASYVDLGDVGKSVSKTPTSDIPDEDLIFIW